MLKGDRDTILERLQARVGHYMNPNLLDSQLAIVEEPDPIYESSAIVDITFPVGSGNRTHELSLEPRPHHLWYRANS
jgi:gluconate kinase